MKVNVKKIIIITAIIIAVSAFSFSNMFSKNLYTNISNSELLELMKNDDITIVDVRYTSEWLQTGVLPDSKLLTTFTKDRAQKLKTELVKNKFQSIPKNKKIVIVCAHGYRSRVVSALLTNKLGYTNVYNLNNGITSWIRYKNPIQKPQKTNLL